MESRNFEILLALCSVGFAKTELIIIGISFFWLKMVYSLLEFWKDAWHSNMTWFNEPNSPQAQFGLSFLPIL